MHEMTASIDEERAAPPRIPDTELIDQRGQSVRFYSDVMKGHIVVINTIFTTCTTICPPMGANYAKLQKILRTQGATNVKLISISVDPLVDTPERLTKWAGNFGAGPEWTLLTGTRSNVQTVLKALRVFAADKNEHTSMVLIGDDTGTNWVRTNALASPARLAELALSRKGP